MNYNSTPDSQLFDNQGHWWSQLASNQVSTGQYPNQQQQKKKQKNKSRGNRKLQRYRAKLHRRGLDDQAIAQLTNFETNLPKAQEQQQPKINIIYDNREVRMPVLDQETAKNGGKQVNINKRKRTEQKSNDTTLVKSLSRISISQPTTKKACYSTTNNGSNKNPIHFVQEKSDISSKALPDYLTVSDVVFKRQLLAEVTSERIAIERWLELEPMLQYARRCAYLTNDLCYLKAEQDFWEIYITTAIIEANWLSQLSKQIMTDNRINWSYCKTEKNIQKRRKTIQNKVEMAAQQLNEHLQQYPSLLLRPSQQSIINRDIVSAAILSFVHKGQQRLRNEFKRKETTLKVDIKDVRLVKSFHEMHPTQEQIRSANIIWQATADEQRANEEVAILKQRLLTNRLPHSYDLLDHSVDNIETILSQPGFRQDKRILLASSRQKRIAHYKSEMMALTIESMETLVRSHAQVANEEMKLTWLSRTSTYSSSSWKILLDIIQQPVFFRPRSGGSNNKSNCWPLGRRSISNKITSYILPSWPIITTNIPFTPAEQALLACLPNYITCCQSQFSRKSIDTIVDQESEGIHLKIRECLSSHCMLASDQHAKTFFNDSKTYLHRLYSTPISRKLLARAKRENQLVLSIQRKLKDANAIIRRTDKSKVFYICNANEFEQKGLNYMIKTRAYEEITTNINPYEYILNSVISLLNSLKEKQAITIEQWKIMMPDRIKCELPHLYFIPKAHKIDIPLRPIMSYKRSPVMLISKFLNDFLAPIYLKVARKTTYISGIDVLRQLEQYRDSGRLSNTTQFVIFDVTDLYTMIPRDGALEALGRFLSKYLQNGRIGNIKIDTILRLARLVLDNNYFVYGNKYYKQIKGGAMGSPFTMVLANIYMLEWEQPLIEHQQHHKQLYGRYIDDVFMTTNLTHEQITIELENAKQKDPNIGITYSIASTVDFLDVAIENKNSQLKTSVFHKPAAEPCILPYLSDHPRNIHRNIIYGGLLRAARYSSTVEDFDRERLKFECTLINSGYVLKFINYHFKRFFKANQAMSVWRYLDSEKYQQLHKKLLNQPTRQEKKRQKKSSDFNDLAQYLPTKKLWDRDKLIVHYHYQSGPTIQYRRELRRLWKTYYVNNKSLVKNVQLTVGIRTNPSLEHRLVKKKPPRIYLGNV